jgi:hypothetical protein
MRRIGFSTGAIAKADYRKALADLRAFNIQTVELSALRRSELPPLISDLRDLGLDDFDFVSFHAPSRFEASDEHLVVESLDRVWDCGIPIVIHPDVIYTSAMWEHFGSLLFIENMDKRKPVGRTASDLGKLFQQFPSARLCLDIGHARQVDPTMMEARLILEQYPDRLAQVHISEVNTASRHDPISPNAVRAFRSIAHLIPEHIPIILETLIDRGQSTIPQELSRAAEALTLQSEDRVALAG